MRSDVHLDGLVQMPVCPDCHVPLLWLLPEVPMCTDHKHTWWCPVCQEAVTVAPR